VFTKSLPNNDRGVTDTKGNEATNRGTVGGSVFSAVVSEVV
jgi:hypothetical protein